MLTRSKTKLLDPVLPRLKEFVGSIKNVIHASEIQIKVNRRDTTVYTLSYADGNYVSSTNFELKSNDFTLDQCIVTILDDLVNQQNDKLQTPVDKLLPRLTEFIQNNWQDGRLQINSVHMYKPTYRDTDTISINRLDGGFIYYHCNHHFTGDEMEVIIKHGNNFILQLFNQRVDQIQSW